MSNLPSAFDTSLGTNFTQSSCPQFFSDFLKNDSFIQCYPMSFFLQNSRSYVQIVRSGISSVQQVLNTSCSVDYTACSSLMTDLGLELISSSNCHDDFQLQNPLVTQAYADFNAYSVVYATTCLKSHGDSIIKKRDQSGQIRDIYDSLTDYEYNLSETDSNDLDSHGKDQSLVRRQGATSSSSSSSSSSNTSTPVYCYTDALFNIQDSGDAYLYLLPLGIQYPSTFTPSCSSCTQAVMALFHFYTGNLSQSISYTYDSVASIISSNCSSGFINSTAFPLPSASASDSGHHSKNSGSNTTVSYFNLILMFMIFSTFVISF